MMMRQASPAQAEPVLSYARPHPHARPAWRATPVIFAGAAMLAELGAFTSIALGYNGRC
jgi:hypothetical protein